MLNAAYTTKVAELAPVLEGKPDVTKIDRIELERLAREFRTQRIIFETARDVYDQMASRLARQQGSAAGATGAAGGAVHPLRQDCHSPAAVLPGRIAAPAHPDAEHDPRRAAHPRGHPLRQPERLEPVFDRDHPIRATGEMRTWYTGKPCAYTKKSHINVCVYDSTWEAADAFQLDESPHVAAWAKNDHLGFEVLYIDRGVVRKYRPDFLIRLATGDMLILETKGQDTEQDHVKWQYLDEWVQAVNQQGGFGRWRWDVAKQPGDVLDILAKHVAAA